MKIESEMEREEGIQSGRETMDPPPEERLREEKEQEEIVRVVSSEEVEEKRKRGEEREMTVLDDSGEMEIEDKVADPEEIERKVEVRDD